MLPFGILLEEPSVLLITINSVQIARAKKTLRYISKWKIKYAFKIFLEIVLSLLKI